MRRTLLAVLWGPSLGLVTSACPADDAPPPATEPSDAGPDDAATTTRGPSPTGTTQAADTSEPAPWLEVGWGLDDFNPYDGVLPVVVGPQGLAMFSMPLRGQGFHNPPDSGFDNPEVPLLQAWVDVAGHTESPGGHLTEVVDYPALFYPSFEEPEVLEGVAVWLVLPDAVEPSTLTGQEAHLHVEMVDADGLELSDDHVLVIGEVPPAPKGP